MPLEMPHGSGNQPRIVSLHPGLPTVALLMCQGTDLLHRNSRDQLRSLALPQHRTWTRSVGKPIVIRSSSSSSERPRRPYEPEWRSRLELESTADTVLPPAKISGPPRNTPSCHYSIIFFHSSSLTRTFYFQSQVPFVSGENGRNRAVGGDVGGISGWIFAQKFHSYEMQDTFSNNTRYCQLLVGLEHYQ